MQSAYNFYTHTKMQWNEYVEESAETVQSIIAQSPKI